MTQKRGYLAEIAQPYQTPELKHFIAEGRLRNFEPGEHLITEGERTTYIYDILQGTVALARNGRDGGRQILAFMSSRQFIGASSTERYPNLVTALTPVSAISYPRTALDKALITTPAFALEFCRSLTRVLESAHDHVYTIGQRAAVERIASFLLYLRANQARFAAGGPRDKSEHIVLPMTRLDIADFLGLTIETVSRAFSSLKKAKIIDFSDSHSCEILDLDKIRDLGGRDDFTQHRGS